MSYPYGPLRKTPWLLLIFAVPSLAVGGVGIGLVWQETESLGAALRSPVSLITGALMFAGMIWGVVFTRKPIVELTPEALVWPDNRRLEWSEVASVEAGQSDSAVASANTGTRTVVHEVMRLNCRDGEVVKIVTTWAAVGPAAANDQITKAFAGRVEG